MLLAQRRGDSAGWGDGRLSNLVREFVERYHTEQPHQWVGNVLPSGQRWHTRGDCQPRAVQRAV